MKEDVQDDLQLCVCGYVRCILLCFILIIKGADNPQMTPYILQLSRVNKVMVALSIICREVATAVLHTNS